MGGDGGDNGYQARQDQIEAGKQQARNALNALFGVSAGDTSGLAKQLIGPAPDRSKFFFADTPGRYMPTGENSDVYIEPIKGQADQAGYDAAMADYNTRLGAKQSELTGNAQSREGLYKNVRDNAFTAGKTKLDEDYADAQRKNKFELFARGLAGGSEDIDQNARAKRTYDQGIIDLGAKADAAKANFRNTDEQTRLQLLDAINSGTDQGSALSAATNRMAVAADQAAADAQGTALGNVFDTAGLLYGQSQASLGKQAAQDWWNQYGNSGRKPAGAPTGVSTRLPGE